LDSKAEKKMHRRDGDQLAASHLSRVWLYFLGAAEMRSPIEPLDAGCERPQGQRECLLATDSRIKGL
jgi:hypothetical protein